MLNKLSSQLLQDAFGPEWGRARVEWWRFDANGKVDPDTHRWYPASAADPGEDCAVYYCVGLLKAGAKRANENVERVHVLTIDDVGTKIDREGMELLAPRPSWVIETSPGNFQWQYMIDGGVDPAAYAEVRAVMKLSPIWGKSEATAPANLVRLPQGVNGKPGAARDWKVRALP